jgi:hypothetical protein
MPTAFEIGTKKRRSFERARLQPCRENSQKKRWALAPGERILAFEEHPSGAKARFFSSTFSARLKPCPFKTESTVS